MPTNMKQSHKIIIVVLDYCWLDLHLRLLLVFQLIFKLFGVDKSCTVENVLLDLGLLLFGFL
jgi:hypothetical protein